MHLIETQNKRTIAKWCVDYAKKYILSIYEKTYPEDSRVKEAIDGAQDWLNGNTTLVAAKKLIHRLKVQQEKQKKILQHKQRQGQ